jgi:hypothetical protein
MLSALLPSTLKPKPTPSPLQPPPAVRATTSVAPTDSRPYRDRYLDEVSPASVVGRMIKFGRMASSSPPTMIRKSRSQLNLSRSVMRR